MQNMKTARRLLTAELAVTNTYGQIMNRLTQDATAQEKASLMPIYEDHKAAVASLQAQIRAQGGLPAEESELSDKDVNIASSNTIPLNMQTTLTFLQDDEITGTKDYEKALLDNELPLSVRYLIEWKLLLGRQWHIRTLGQLLADLATA